MAAFASLFVAATALPEVKSAISAASARAVSAPAEKYAPEPVMTITRTVGVESAAATAETSLRALPCFARFVEDDRAGESNFNSLTGDRDQPTAAPPRGRACSVRITAPGVRDSLGTLMPRPLRVWTLFCDATAP